MGIIYPQYWSKGGNEETFAAHLQIIKDNYCVPKHIGTGKDEKLIPPVLDAWRLETQQGMFKTAMMSNAERVMEPPFDVNPLTRLWRLLSANFHTNSLFSEYVKLAEIAMVHVLGSVEDERCFSSVSFLKDKLRNALEEHLPLVVGMYSQKIYTIESFPYDSTFDKWNKGAQKHGRYCLAA